MDSRSLPPAKETIKARKESPLVQFSDKIGKAQIVEKDSAKNSSSNSSPGFHCRTCRASFTSSDAFLDHCNGKIHQKNLGVSLRIERVDEVDRIKSRLKQLTHKRIATELVTESKNSTHFEEKLDKAETEILTLKEERKSRKKQKRRQKNEPLTEDESEEVHINDDLISAMGFKSFA